MTEPDVDALIAWHEEAARRLDGPGLGQTGDYHTKAATALRTLQERCKELEAALKEGRRAIGDHWAPNDCYATGPMTGDAIRDLVQCPACSFIALHDAALKGADQ